MNPGISKFPSSWFYGSRLKDGVQVVDKPPPQGIPWPKADLPVAVISVDGKEERANVSLEMASIPLEFTPGSTARGATGRKTAQPSADKEGVPGTDGASYRNIAEAQIALQAVHAMLRSKDIKSAAVSFSLKVTPTCNHHGPVHMTEMHMLICF
jgi:hypothetical protein